MRSRSITSFYDSRVTATIAESAGLAGDDLLFIWTLYLLGVLGAFTMVLAVRALSNNR